MRLHRLNCISTRLPGGRLLHGDATHPGLCTSHCLLVDTGDGLVLIDTGLGLGDVLDPEQRLAPIVRSLLKPDLRAEMTALRQIERMGFRADDVRDIVLTHLDFDQAGGLDDFPRARVHLLAREQEHALSQRGWGVKQRYRPSQWSTRNRWVAYDRMSIAPWLGLSCVRELSGVPEGIVLVPLPGHTPGHCGVAVRADDRWYLHAGDAYCDARELDADPQCRFGMRVYQSLTQTNARARLATQRVLRKLHAEHPDVILSCTHDAREFERLTGRPANALPDPVSTSDVADPYTRKIVRAPRDVTLAPRSVPGIEVVDHEGDPGFDFDALAHPSIDPPAPPRA
ncbi:MAG: MBL fold metallo-hydrolase [Lysobacter sp.]|nr:MBL fold metallo-hydrolase [Lysobacter sp.]